MLSPSEPSAAPRPLDGPPSTPSIPTLHSGSLDREADSSPAGPSSPLVDASSHLPDKDSSFEDLEQFLAISEPQTPGANREPLLECLKSTVKDIHNAIGEPAGTRQELLQLYLPALKSAKTLSTLPQEQAFSPEGQALAYPCPSDSGWRWCRSSGAVRVTAFDYNSSLAGILDSEEGLKSWGLTHCSEASAVCVDLGASPFGKGPSSPSFSKPFNYLGSQGSPRKEELRPGLRPHDSIGSGRYGRLNK